MEKSKKTSRTSSPLPIARAKSKLTVMAGLWERWRDAATGEVIKSCTVITTTSNSLVAPAA